MTGAAGKYKRAYGKQQKNQIDDGLVLCMNGPGLHRPPIDLVNGARLYFIYGFFCLLSVIQEL